MNLRVAHCLDGGPLESWRRLSQMSCRLSFLTLRLTALRNLVRRSVSRVEVLLISSITDLVDYGFGRCQLGGGLQNRGKE